MVVYQFAFPPAMYKHACFPTLLPTQVLFDLKTKQNLVVNDGVFHYSFIFLTVRSFHVLRSSVLSFPFFPIFFLSHWFDVLPPVVNMSPTCLLPL